jgi:hypothetical protein
MVRLMALIFAGWHAAVAQRVFHCRGLEANLAGQRHRSSRRAARWHPSALDSLLNTATRRFREPHWGGEHAGRYLRTQEGGTVAPRERGAISSGGREYRGGLLDERFGNEQNAVH